MDAKDRLENDWKSQLCAETVDTKCCSQCGKIKSLTEFSAQLRGRKKVKSRCKACICIYSKQKGETYRKDDASRFFIGDSIYC